MKTRFARTSLTVAVALALTACGGGGSNLVEEVIDPVTEPQSTVGFDLPSEISAIPVDPNNTSGQLVRQSFSAGNVTAAAATASELPADSDYARAIPRRFIEERALEQFAIVEQVLNAMAQTNYALEENINAGPYKAMIAWEDEQDGRSVKTLQPWVVDSQMIVEDGEDVNRVLAWIEETDAEGVELIRAEFKIYTAATLDQDGTALNYGEWDLNVKFGEGEEDFFVATSRIDGDSSVVQINEYFAEDNFVQSVRGVMHRSGTEGYGQVEYPDWESCFSAEGDGGSLGGPEECVPELATVSYSYNSDFVAVQNGNDPIVYKDRVNTVEMTHRYGLFYGNDDSANGVSAGDSVARHLDFGFPVFYDDNNGFRQYAYYGAWQGRHELWGGGENGVPAGTVVTRESFGDQEGQRYTVSDVFQGTFTMRTLADADLNDVKDVPVETFINQFYDLMYDANNSEWVYCEGFINWHDFPVTCDDHDGTPDIGFTAVGDDIYGALEADDSGQKWVWVGRWDDNTQQDVNYVYLDADPGNGFNWSGAGFYVAEMDQWGQLTAALPGEVYSPADGDFMYVNISGSIFIEYTGDYSGSNTGWVQKTLSSYENWVPEFAPDGDAPFSPDIGSEYYMNANGANYIVKRRAEIGDASDYEVKSELQASANPVNIDTLLPAGTDHLRTPWRPEVTYELDTDSTSDTFMKLVVASDETNNLVVGAVQTDGEWGLQAYNSAGQPLKADGTPVAVDEYGFPTDPDARPVEFNWEYSEFGWGTQQFLLSGDDIVVLSDPVALQSLQVANGAGETKTLLLAYDGWMHGMPDMYSDLSQNEWVMEEWISDKIVNIGAGTEATGVDDTQYFIKPLEISLFMNQVTEGDITGGGGEVPDITLAADVDLDAVPDFTDHGMGDIPEDAELKYSEGLPVAGE